MELHRFNASYIVKVGVEHVKGNINQAMHASEMVNVAIGS